MDFIKELKFDEKGLIPAIAQDAISGEVLMCAYMNEESIKKTIETGHATYFSRSRQELWCKGDTSGHYPYVKKLMIVMLRKMRIYRFTNKRFRYNNRIFTA